MALQLDQRAALDACTGDTDCPADMHVHGCYADTDTARCDNPSDHVLTEGRVVCASCGRFRDKPARESCEAPDWHQPQPAAAPDDVDAVPPETEEDLLAAVGPEPGKTWAELYARVALQLSYRSAELCGAMAELERLRAGGRLASGINDADATALVAALVHRARGKAELRVARTELETRRRLRTWVEPATGELILQVEDQ